MGKRPFDVAPHGAEHRSGVLKLWAAVSRFDGSVPPRSPSHLDALLAHESSQGGAPWRVALAPNGAVIGTLMVRQLGTRRTLVEIAVNPAWRRQGVGSKLLEAAPAGRRLLVTSRASVEGATAFLERHGFRERHRDARLRRAAGPLERLPLPGWARLEEDTQRSPERFVAMVQAALGEGEGIDTDLGGALLDRPGIRVLYLRTAEGDHGVCLVTALDRSKKAERQPDGTPTVGLLEHVGLTRACRGKGLSRPFIHAGLALLLDDGYQTLEVTADGRRAQAHELYEGLGFRLADEDIRWIRRDDEA
jgi:GNAT superfamily N-acetyltransferase